MFVLLIALACGPSFHDVQKEGTIEAFEAFLVESPNDPNAAIAKIRLEEMYLEKAREEKTLTAYDTYLTLYQDKPGSQLVATGVAERETFLYEWAQGENSIAGWEKYLGEYPSGSGKDGKKRRVEAKKRIKVLGYMDHLEIGPVELEPVNLAEDPDGPLNGWSFFADVTNTGDRTLLTLNMELQYLDGAGSVIETDRWPLVAPRAPGNIPIEEEWKVPVKAGETRTYTYMDAAPDAPGWAKRARLVPIAVVFAGEEE